MIPQVKQGKACLLSDVRKYFMWFIVGTLKKIKYNLEQPMWKKRAFI